MSISCCPSLEGKPNSWCSLFAAAMRWWFVRRVQSLFTTLSTVPASKSIVCHLLWQRSSCLAILSLATPASLSNHYHLFSGWFTSVHAERSFLWLCLAGHTRANIDIACLGFIFNARGSSLYHPLLLPSPQGQMIRQILFAVHL